MYENISLVISNLVTLNKYTGCWAIISCASAQKSPLGQFGPVEVNVLNTKACRSEIIPRWKPQKDMDDRKM